MFTGMACIKNRNKVVMIKNPGDGFAYDVRFSCITLLVDYNIC